MGLAISTYRSENNPRDGVDPTEKSHVASRSWEWLKQSLWQSGLVGTICTLAGRSMFLWPSHPVIALDVAWQHVLLLFSIKTKFHKYAMILKD